MEKDTYFSSQETSILDILKTEKSQEWGHISGRTGLQKKDIGRRANLSSLIKTKSR